jgi:hypothetical protein
MKQATLRNLTTKTTIETITIRAEGSSNSNLNLSIGIASGVSHSHRITTTGNVNILKASHVNILLDLLIRLRGLTLRPNLTLAGSIIHSYAIKASDSCIIKRLHITARDTLESVGLKLVTLCPLTGKLTINEH